MSFSPRGGAVISFAVEGAQSAQREIETVGGAFNTLSNLATASLRALAAGYAAINIGAYVKDSVLLAARYETLGVVMTNVGKNAGYTASAMEGFAKSLQSTGISMIQSRESLTALAQAHVNLSESMKLARIAQDAAVIGGINSSEAFQRMVVGLQQGDVEILRNLGLNVNFQAAYALTAATLHKHVDLLTETEMTQARVNALLAVGTDVAGTYEAAMGTAGKQLSSMSRYMEDLKVKVGSVFLDGFTRQIELQTMAFKALGLAMDESLADGSLTQFATTVGEATGKVVAGLVMVTNFASEHGTAIKSLIATYLIYKGVLLALPLAEAAVAAAGYAATLVTQGTVTWGATGAALALAQAQVVNTETAVARALSSNAVAVAAVGEAEAVLAATTSVQGQFIAMGQLTAAQATAAATTQTVAVTQGEAAVAATALTAAEGAATVGTYALATAMGTLQAVMAVLLSPITLIVAALAAATAAYMYFRKETEKEVKSNLPTFEDTREQLRKLNEEQKYGTGLLGENAKQIEAVTNKVKELNLAKEAKTATMGSTDSLYTLRLKSEVAGITEEIKKYKVQLDQLQDIRDKIGGGNTRTNLGSYEALNALTAKYTLPPARRADVEKSVQPAVDAARKRVENTTFAGDTDLERAKAKADALAAIDLQANNVRLGIQYQFASETNTANKAREVDATNAATRLAAINSRALADAKTMYDLRLISYADFVAKENALNEKEAAQALAVAEEKVRVARMTVGGDPAANAQALKTAIAERDAQISKNAEQAARGRQSAADAAIESYTKEFGSVESLADAQQDLVRNSQDARRMAGLTFEQQEIQSALRMQSIAQELAAEMERRRQNGEATAEYLRTTGAMAQAMEQFGAARLKATATNVATGFINDAKQMADETAAIYGQMKDTFLSTDEERVRSAAAASIRLADIRKADALAAIDKTNDTDGQKAAARQKVLADYERYVSAVTENAQAKVDQASTGFYALNDALSMAFDPNRIETFGSAMEAALGRSGGAIGNMVDALTTYDAQQKASDEARKQAQRLYAGDAEKLAKANQALNLRSTRDALSYYGSMAGAAKGFFNENSKGYKAMEAVQQAFHAVELALAIESALTKAGLIAGVTAAETTNAASRVATQATATAASTGLAATEASAWGITAVVKAIASLPFPFNLAAGAATLAAVVGIGAKVSGSVGGASVSVSEQRQQAQGTGTVLGNGSAKSESISRAIELSASNSSTQINYLSGMLTSLRAIEYGIGSFASQIVNGTDISNPKVGLNTNNGFATTLASAGLTAGGAAIGGMAGAGLTAFTSMGAIGGPLGMAAGALLGYLASKSSFVGKIATGLFGGKQSVEDSGFTMDRATLATIMARGANANQYADIKTSGGLFRSSKRSTQTTSLGVDANAQFSLIIESLADAIGQAGDLLGVSGAGFEAKLNSFVIDIGKISLKDMTGEEIQKELESVFSKLGDQMAQFAIGGLTQFQKVGEGYLETLTRVATDYARIDASMQSIGRTFGMTGMQSIAARESLVELMGGIDKLQSQTATFAQNFLTQAEQLAPVQAYVTEQLAALNMGWVDTRDEFKQVILAQDLTTASGRQTYATLMGLVEAFAATHAAAEDLSKTEQQIADERKDLQDQFDQLTMTSAELLAKQRDALDESNRALFDQVQAAQKVRDAQDAAKTSLGNFLNQMKSFAETAAGMNNNLVLGDLSTFTPEQQYIEARKQFEQTRQLAAAGDATAQGNLQSVEQAFLQLSMKLNAGDAQYSSDLATVMRANDEMAAWALDSVDVAQASLNALNDQSASLQDISGILTAIAQGVQYLPAALTGQDVPAFTPTYVPNVDRSGAGAVDMAPLVAEVKALREEVRALRADAKQQTRDKIDATVGAAQQAAETVVAGQRAVATDAAWAANSTREPS